MSKPWVLVTGASGFLGSMVTKKLIERGERVRALVRAGSKLGAFDELPSDQFELAYGDVLVEHTVFRALYGCDRLLHLATHFEWGVRDKKLVMDSAVQGTQAVLQAARKRGITKTVVTSSYATLGVSHTQEAMTEEHAFNLTSPEVYVRAKQEAEAVALEAAREGDPVVVVLPTSVVGPGDRKPTPNGRLLLFYLRTPPGIELSAPRGGINIVDVEDVAMGHLAALDKGAPGERYILGGENLTFAELLNALSDVTGLGSGREKDSATLIKLLVKGIEVASRLRGLDPPITSKLVESYTSGYAWADSSKAEDDLGYTHRSARLALSRSVQWFLEQGYVPDRFAERVRLELRSA